ncbi:MAG TPA: maltose alpha-D-glucosyltransferase, partial [Chitinispirillaceae bacterium]|nr:maltose alpha-D-glucosyltransferase [Chitinispirillaceae bacterium]
DGVSGVVDSNPEWFKDAIIYEVHVRAFKDSNGDGIGDFGGLTESIDYFRTLGITALWLLPFYPSPLKDDGYDISDYFNIHRDYGTLRDFKEFLHCAHANGIKVISELVLNHTSSEHQWFKKARRSKKDSHYRHMYVWSDTPHKFQDARIIFKDFELSNWSWDPEVNSYYWHRFYSHQPDLNFENPLVQKSLFKVIDFWMGLGIDGLRLDAVPYLFEREGTNCENLPETHSFLKLLRKHVDDNFPNRMLLAEANQWPEDAAAYMGNGDECHMAFHFPLMPRMFMSIQMEDSFPIMDILRYTPSVPSNCQWALFLRNHDELTLEMVTDEERDYMYRVYASDTRAKINLGIRRRMAPLLINDRRKIELMNILLFSLPGTPIIYYGDEIGMGDNFYLGDRDGVRTPMQWSSDKNAGFSKVNPHQLYLPVIIDPEYHYETINVTNQDSNFASLLWWMRRTISMRKKFKVFGRGSFSILNCSNSKIFAFVRELEDEIILVIVNLSRYTQVATIDAKKYAGLVPEEVFGKTIFPVIKEHPYLIMLGSYDYYWFLLGKIPEETGMTEEYLPSLSLKRSWEEIFKGDAQLALEERILPRYLTHCRWFCSKTKKINKLQIIENSVFSLPETIVHNLLLKVHYSDGSEELYQLALSFLLKQTAFSIVENFPQAIICDIRVDEHDGVVYDCIYNETLQKMFFDVILSRKRIKVQTGCISGISNRQKFTLQTNIDHPVSRVLKAERSNTPIIFGETWFLKVYRRLESGTNPELEIFQFLSSKQFPSIPSFEGFLEYQSYKGQNISLGVLQKYVTNSGDAWSYVTGVAKGYFESILVNADMKIIFPEKTSLNVSFKVPSDFANLTSELFLEMITLLGKRTAQMHCILSSEPDDPHFAPEPFSLLYQRSLFQSIQGLVQKSLRLLEKKISSIQLNYYDEAKFLLHNEQILIDSLRQLIHLRIKTSKIRIHGDYHLGQVLYTGKDFIIIDFEGDPSRPLSERKLKRSPFKDVAGLIRSIDCAAFYVLTSTPEFTESHYIILQQWIEPWYHCVSGLFIQAYLQECHDASFIPPTTEQIETLLQAFLIEKAAYELIYELNNHPESAFIPLKGLTRFCREKALLRKAKAG